jgi:maltose O-acetyltransferase
MMLAYELKLWLMHFIKSIPGRMGCAIRARCLPVTIGTGSRIWDGVHIDSPSRLVVGSCSSINRGSVLNAGGGISIGDNVLIGPGVVIYSLNHVFASPDMTINQQGYEEKPVTIGDDVWLGVRSIILPGVTVRKGAVVAAGAVVTKDVAEYDIVAGVPAQRIGSRSEGMC